MGGWYDIFQPGTVDAFISRENEGGEGARGRNYLVMGWRTHNNDSSPDYKMPSTDPAVESGDIANRLFAHYLKGDEKALDGIPKVQYYVMGDDRDPDAPGKRVAHRRNLAPLPHHGGPFHLAPEGLISRDTSAPGRVAGVHLDPKNPVPTLGGANLLPNLRRGPMTSARYQAAPTS
jgi:hypothetical protein